VDEVFGTDTASEDGKEILLGLRGSGDLLGEMGALSNSKIRPATVTAATPLRGSMMRAATRRASGWWLRPGTLLAGSGSTGLASMALVCLAGAELVPVSLPVAVLLDDDGRQS
jgi:hypothetical protein